MQEIIHTLMNCTGSKCRIKRNDETFFFTYNKKDNYWINRIENKFYGLAITKDGNIIYGYPHLWNLKDIEKVNLQNMYIELKLNGTNIIISRYDNQVNIRTRMNPYTTEFPVPPYWNETINSITDEKLRNKLLEMRTYVLNKYPQWYINEADGTYIGLKIQEVIRSMLDVDSMTLYYPHLVFYFELTGMINPVIVDSEAKYGMYDYDYKITLFDIFNKNTGLFLNRQDKEQVANEFELEIVPVMYCFSTVGELAKSLPKIKEEADKQLIEGYVCKSSTGDMVKIKSDIVLQSAYRLEAMLKGFIAFTDMQNYISKVVSAEYLKQPEKFDYLVESIMLEAEADYPNDIIQKQKHQIQKQLAHYMSILVVDEILKDIKFSTPDELYRFLNLEIPKRFEPLKSYIDFTLEKSTDDKHLREKMKRRRTELFSKVSRHVMKKLNIDRGTYR